jgi:hypothetical protein
MKKRITFLLISLTPLITTGQNLISNGSFEDTIACPPGCALLENAVGWIDPVSISSSDLIHICSAICDYTFQGYQLPKTGLAHAGIIVSNVVSTGREYLEKAIDSSLIAGECYHVEFYMSSGIYKYATDDIQVYFSDTLLSNISQANAFYNYLPQVHNSTGNFPDTVNWTLVQGDFVAQGGENYMIIGNFKDLANTNVVIINSSSPVGYAYVYIDDVSLTKVICTGLNELLNPIVQINPNPATENIQFSINSNELYEFQIYDSASRLYYSESFHLISTVNVSNFDPGIYIYRFINKERHLNGKLVIY